MVKAPGPVDRDIGLMVCKLTGGVERGTGVEGTVAVEAIEDWAIVAHIVGITSIA